MPGRVSLVAFYITLLPVQVRRVRQLRQLCPLRQLRQLRQLRRVRRVRQVPEQVRVQVPVQVPQPSGVQPASALLPSCSQPLREKTLRRKAGRE